MPIARYEIRNEYGLADPELYRTADKDDPEALLEGVAMAGLVGVLRQLGDLAEFAAEIFHNLHEDVMATAARGHGLMVRVQQLETEIPSIEKAFLSQTDHSSFFYHSGVEWHPNLHLDHNLITQGDLPRFIMDSYEECRAPPRLFLLDKFDVAGAGACLKRYTDPSYFKVETSEIISANVQREKKIRKIKKKVPRWRNEETPEVVSTHTKLHQLFLEERVESGIGKHTFHAKLKRRLNGFPFDSKTGKSYMEKLLKSPSPDHKVLHKVTANSSSLMTARDDHKESDYEIFEFRQVSPPTSPDGEENMLNHSTNEPSKPPINDKLWEVHDLYPSIATDGISSALDNENGEKVVFADAEGDREESFTGYQSDDIASEMDNFVDAPSNMESEMDGDSEFRMKSGITTSSHIKNESSISDADEEHLHTRSSDSQSSGDSTISGNVDNSSTKEMSFFSSDSPSTSLENPQAENSATEVVQCADVTVNEKVDAPTYQKTANEDFQVDPRSKSAVIDDTCTKTNAITNHRSEFEQLTSSLCTNGSISDLARSDSEDVTKDMLKAHEFDETVTTLEGEGNKENLVLSPIHSPSLCGFESQSEDDSPESSAAEHLADEQSGECPPCLSAVPDIYCHTADSSGKTSSDSLHEDESDWNYRGSIDDVANTSDVLHDLLTNGTPENILSENLIPGKLEDEFPEVPENSSSNCPVTAHNGDGIELAVSKEDSLINVLDDEDSNGSTGSPNQFHHTTEASLEKKLEETSLINSQTVNVEDDHSNISTDNQISSNNLKLSHGVNSPDRMTEGFDAHGGDILPEEETTTDGALALETLEPCEVVGSRDIGVTHLVLSNDLEDLGSSCRTPGDLEEPAGTSGTVETDGISLCVSSTGEEVAQISDSDLKSVGEVHELLDKSDSEADKSIPTNTASAVPAVSDNASLDKLVEDHNGCSMDELEKDENYPLECHGASYIMEKVVPEGSASGFETVFSNAVNYGHPESEVSGTFPNLLIDSEVNHSLKIVHAATIESPVEQYDVDKEEELFKQSGLENNAPDCLPLLFDSDIKESIAQVKTGLPLSQLEQDLLHPGEITSVLPSSPINHQKIIGHPKDQLGSFFPPINPFSETNQINLSDTPPLPPLPPVEWRMGKFQHASSSTDGEIMRPKEVSPQLISPLPPPSDSVNSPPGPTSTNDIGSYPQTAPANDIDSSLEEIKHSPVEISPETVSKEENVENSCSSLEVGALHGNKEEGIVKPSSEGVSTSPAEEDGVGKDSRTVKLPRPRNPLIEDVAVLDKSKLRKITERVRPEIQKVDERDSLLEQIRTKSFNLKPAMASRPSIRGPNTNLKVVAILEKANAIRQAFAGSDDDDSDSWSDS